MSDALLRVVAPLITLVWGLSYLVGEWRLALYGWRTRNWVAGDGVVLHSEVRAGPAPVAWGRGSRLLNYPSVIYRYSVGSTQYHGSHLGYCGNWSITKWTPPWKTGDHVRVWYNPACPSDAVLQVGVSSTNILAVALGLVVVALTMYWLWVAARAA